MRITATRETAEELTIDVFHDVWRRASRDDAANGTVLGVMFPTFGGAIAGIRFFGDFERFAAISEVTFQRLGEIAERIELLQAAPDIELSYDRVAQLAQATDDVVISEIENWQAVFRGKRITEIGSASWRDRVGTYV